MKLPSTLRLLVAGSVNAFMSLARGERVLQCAAYCADKLKVREEGHNHGEWVESFLGNADVEAGNPWCASAMAFCCDASLVDRPKVGAAAVLTWKRWSKATDKWRSDPSRGRMCYKMHTETTGHIGIVVRSALGVVYSIEGNTSSGEAGSQRDGDGFYRRFRKASFWDGYIEL